MKFDEAQPIIEKMLSAPSDYNLLFSQREALKSALAEVERLREVHAALLNVSTAAVKSMEAKLAAMREIVQALAALESHMDGTGIMRAPIYWNVEVSPLVEKARAILEK